MKHFILYTMLCVSLALLTGCSNEKKNIIENEVELTVVAALRSVPSLNDTVSMEVVEITETRVTVEIFNNSEYEIITGLPFSVEVFVETDWRIVPWDGFPPPFTDVAIPVFAGDSEEFIKNLNLFVSLEHELYRIRKEVFRAVDNPLQNKNIHDVVAEFSRED